MARFVSRNMVAHLGPGRVLLRSAAAWDQHPVTPL